MEYKGPTDNLNINDYYKICGYSCFYIGDAEHVLEIDPQEVTMTFVCNHYPQEMLSYLQKTYNIGVKCVDSGIYYLQESRFPVQIIINHELDPGKNLWLYSLRGGLSIEELERVLNDYADHKDSKAYQSAMDLITRANWEKMKEEKNMCQALRELFADELAEREEYGRKIGEEYGRKIGERRGERCGEKRGERRGRKAGEQQLILSLIQIKLKKGKTIAQIADDLERSETEIQALMNKVVDNQ